MSRKNTYLPSIKEEGWERWVSQLKALAGLPEDLGLIPSTHGGSQLSITPVPVALTSFSDLYRHQAFVKLDVKHSS